jgi:hypothetical protein
VRWLVTIVVLGGCDLVFRVEPKEIPGIEDNFDGTSIDSAIWTLESDPGIDVGQNNGRLVFDYNATATAAATSVVSIDFVDLRGGCVRIDVDRIDPGAIPITLGIAAVADGTHFYDIVYNDDDPGSPRVNFAATADGSVTSEGSLYNATEHRGFRIRHDRENAVVRAEALDSNGLVLNFAEFADTLVPLDKLRLQILAVEQSPGAPGRDAKFDNVSTDPSVCD